MPQLSANAESARNPQARKPLCVHYQNGECIYGRKCRKFHPTACCRDELKRRGSCARGAGECTFSHNLSDLDSHDNQRQKRPGSSAAPGSDTSGSDMTRGSARPGQGHVSMKPAGNKISTPDDVCLNFQVGKCNQGASCPHFHPQTPCMYEFAKPGSCLKGPYVCTFSHNPLTLHVQTTSHIRPPTQFATVEQQLQHLAVYTPSASSASDIASSAPDVVPVCRNFQKGTCKLNNCARYHPPPTKICPFFDPKQPSGSCKSGLDCRFSHNVQPGPGPTPGRRPNLKPVDITYRPRGINLFWMKAANSAGNSRKLGQAAAKKLVTLDALSGKAGQMGVDLMAGSYNSKKKWSQDREAPPLTIRLRGPLNEVQQLEAILKEQEAILDKLPKHKASWMFADHPWAEKLWSTNQHEFQAILDKEANNVHAWWDPVTSAADGNGKSAGKATTGSRVSTGKKVQREVAEARVMSLALTKIKQTELQVVYTPNIVSADADAIIIR